MELVEQVKTMTKERVAGAMLRLLSHVSPETFMNLSMLASRLIVLFGQQALKWLGVDTRYHYPGCGEKI